MKKLLFLLLGVTPWLTIQAAEQGLPRVELSASVYRIDAEVAVTREAQMRGLMYRQTMPEQNGMLFVFDTAAKHCMWMKNTLLPLAVAFLDEQGRIINVEEMQPQTENPHCATAPARYALEMNAGWFSRRHLGAGVLLQGLQQAPVSR